MSKMKLLVLLFFILVVASNNVSAAYLYPWGASSTVSDPTNDLLLGSYYGSRDITDAWYVHSGGYHYFRIDLVSAPLVDQCQVDFAGAYGIALDLRVNGSSCTENFTHMPNLVGIDYFIDSHFEPAMGGFYMHQIHEYDDSMAQFFVPPVYLSSSNVQQTENGGLTIEWKIPDSAFGIDGLNDITSFVAYSHDVGSENGTYDYANSVPEPRAMIFFTFGNLLLLYLSKKKRK